MLAKLLQAPHHIGDEDKAMAMHGLISEFKPSRKESWSTYTKRMGHYFTANGVTEAARK